MPGRRERFAYRDMARDEALDVAIAFGRLTGGAFPVQLKLTPDGRSYDVQIPAQVLDEINRAHRDYGRVKRGGER